jgi:hypothetical protein
VPRAERHHLPESETFCHRLVERAIRFLDRITGGKYAGQYPNKPGRHAESIAMDHALSAREGNPLTAGLSGPVGMTLTVVNVQLPPGVANKNGVVTWGQPFVRCRNCRVLTLGADVFSDRLDTIAGTFNWYVRKLQNRDDLLIGPGDSPNPKASDYPSGLPENLPPRGVP